MLMKLTFIGADHEVTGSCHFLEVGDTKVLIDCGMEQGNNPYQNAELPVSYSDIANLPRPAPCLPASYGRTASSRRIARSRA